MTDHMSKPLAQLAADVTADGIVDAQEVKQIRERIYADSVVDREEADFLFAVNDAVSGAANDPGWQELFVEALTKHVLEDEVSPDEVDDDEAEYLMSKIQADGKIDAVELALLVNIMAKAKSTPHSLQDFVLSAVKFAVLEDGIIDQQEVELIRTVIYGIGSGAGSGVDRAEADFIFDLNDATSGKDNHPSWKSLFVEALTKHVLEDDVSPGELDDDETDYLINKIQADDVVDANELALMINITAVAQITTDRFQAFLLSALQGVVLEDGIIDEQEVELIRTVIYGTGSGAGSGVDRAEADFLFDLNDATSGKDNHPSWKSLFIEAIAKHVLEDEVSPGEVDDDEAEWLIGRIEGDQQVDDNEKALLFTIKSQARSLSDKLKSKLDKWQL